MSDFSLIRTNLVEHEGFYYVEREGQFYKGCRRCGGTGHYSFNGYDSICYLCHNDPDAKLGDHFSTEAEAQKWCHERAVRKANADRKREAARLAKLDARQAAWDTLAAEYPQVWELLSKAAGVDTWLVDGTTDKVTERNSFVLKMAEQLWHLDEWNYSERMLTALQAVVEKRASQQAEAAATPAPSGRTVVTGEIVSTRVNETEYGVTRKILVKADEGYKVWVSIPSKQSEEAFYEFLGQIEAEGKSRYDFGPECYFLGTQDGKYAGVKGRRITFTATLEPSRDDVAFAFGSRPAKGAWL